MEKDKSKPDQAQDASTGQVKNFLSQFANKKDENALNGITQNQTATPNGKDDSNPQRTNSKPEFLKGSLLAKISAQVEQKVQRQTSYSSRLEPEMPDLSGIDLDKLRNLLQHPVLQEFCEPFVESPSLPLQQVPSRPELQLIPTDLIFDRPSRQDQRAHPEFILSYEADVIKEEMIGYIDAILQRQDKAKLPKRMETFQIENAARRSLKELMDHFENGKKDTAEKIANLYKLQQDQLKRIDSLSTITIQLRKEIDRVDQVSASLHKVEVDILSNAAQTTRQFNAVNDKVDLAKLNIESRIDSYKLVSEKVDLQEQSIQRLEKLILTTKGTMYDDFSSLRSAFADSIIRVDDKAHSLQRSILDVKFWIDQYNESFKEAEGRFNMVRTEFQGEIEKIQYVLNQKIGITDMHANFKELIDMLIVKFSQIEDVKEGLRDMLVYQKYFYPLQLQTTISENMQQFKLAMQDQNFVQYQHKKYDEMLERTEKLAKQTENQDDVDIKRHLELLEKHHLKVTDWQMARSKIENNFVDYLKEGFVQDLKDRWKLSKDRNAHFANQIRRVLPINAAQDLILDLHKNTFGLRAQLAAVEAELALIKRKEIEKQKIQKLITEQLEIKEEAPFKRQNSYAPKLDFFGQALDHHSVTKQLKATRQSLPRLREHLNTAVKDVPFHKLALHLQFPGGRDSSLEVPRARHQNTRGSATDSRDGSRYKNSKHKHHEDYSDETSSGRDYHQPVQQVVPQGPPAGKILIGGLGNAMRGKFTLGVLEAGTKALQEGQKALEKGQELLLSQQQSKQAAERERTNQADISINPKIKRTKTERQQPISPKKEKEVVIEKTQILLNQEGKLLDHNGQVLDLKYPLTPEDRHKLVKEIREYLQPMASQIAEYQVEKALEPIKRNLISVEANQDAEAVRMLAKIDQEVRGVNATLKKDLDAIQETVDTNLKAIQRMRARDHSDNDQRHKQNEENILKHLKILQDHSTHFDSIGTVTTMLIENINMQMESEISDLLDRRLISLYGFNNPSADLKKPEVTGASKEVRNERPRKQPKHNVVAVTVDKDRDQLPVEAANAEVEETTVSDQVTELNFPKIPGATNIQFFETKSQFGGLQGVPQRHSLLNPNLTKEQRIEQKFSEMAQQQLSNRDALPVTMNQNCLSCQGSGKDTQLTLRLFKLACLSYKPSEITYRNQVMTREALIALRRDLVDKITRTLPNSTLFKDNAMYPRRYFDDLVLSQMITEQQLTSTYQNTFKGTVDGSKIFQEMMQSKMPFGKISGKNFTTITPASKLPSDKLPTVLNEQSGVTLHPRLNSSSGLSGEVQYLSQTVRKDPTRDDMIKLVHGEMQIGEKEQLLKTQMNERERRNDSTEIGFRQTKFDPSPRTTRQQLSNPSTHYDEVLGVSDSQSIRFNNVVVNSAHKGTTTKLPPAVKTRNTFGNKSHSIANVPIRGHDIDLRVSSMPHIMN